MESANRQSHQPKKRRANASKSSNRGANVRDIVIENDQKKTYFSFWATLLLGLVLSFFTIWAVKRGFDEVVEFDAEGKPQLKEERITKLEEDIARVENCQQYALRAIHAGWFPCYSCVDTTWVFLQAGEVYRYGERCDRNDPRYSSEKLLAQNLDIFPEFRGDKKACYQEQQRKIYFYPLLPENLARAKPLGHPPSNKQDR